MNGIVFKRCGCSVPVLHDDGTASTDQQGRLRRRQLGTSGPKLRLADGSWSPDHGTWYFQCDAPGDVPGRNIHIHHGGYPSRKEAEDQATAVRELLAAAEGAAEPADAQVEIARAIRSVLAAGGRLPNPQDIKYRTERGQRPVVPTVAEWLREW